MPTTLPAHTFEHGMFVRTWSGTGAPLLWLHGLGESGLCFEALIGEGGLPGHRHLVPDLPGYGRSPWPARPLALAAVADHLAAWLAWRGEEPAVLVGHSMGGVLATLLAERHGDRVRAVVDVDGNVTLGDCSYSGPAAAEDAEAFRAGGFDRLRARVWELGADDPAHRGYYASLRLADPATFHLHARELVELSAGRRLAVRLAALRCPAAYVAGSPGGASARSLELLARAGVPLARVGPAGHWPFLDRPEEFLRALAAAIP